MKRFLISGFLACLLLNPAGASADSWDTCHQALQELRGATRRASFETMEAPRKEKQLKGCQDFVNRYDVINKRCQKIKKEYKVQIARMRDALGQLQAAIFEVELSCRHALPLGTGASPGGDGGQLSKRMCLSLQRATREMPPKERVGFCLKLRFPGDCAKCLSP